jgi:hypothetical protein
MSFSAFFAPLRLKKTFGAWDNLDLNWRPFAFEIAAPRIISGRFNE